MNSAHKVRGKLMMVTSETTTDEAQAATDLEAILSQDGMLGGSVVATEVRRGLGLYETAYYAAALTIIDIDAEIPIGCSAASKKVAKQLGVKVPRGVDA